MCRVFGKLGVSWETEAFPCPSSAPAGQSVLGHFSGVLFLFLLPLVLLLSPLPLLSCDATCNTAGGYTDQLFILEAKSGRDSFSKPPFSRLSHFCCQVIHVTSYLLSLSYVFWFFFLQSGEERDKTFVFGQEENPNLDYNICLSQSRFF